MDSPDILEKTELPVDCGDSRSLLLAKGTDRGNYYWSTDAVKALVQAEKYLFTKGLDLTAELSKRTVMHGVFGKAMDYAGGEYGEAVLSRYPVLDTKNNPLPHSAKAEPRTALEVQIELPSGAKIAFVGTHLDHLRDQSNRTARTPTAVQIWMPLSG